MVQQDMDFNLPETGDNTSEELLLMASDAGVGTWLVFDRLCWGQTGEEF